MAKGAVLVSLDGCVAEAAAGGVAGKLHVVRLKLDDKWEVMARWLLCGVCLCVCCVLTSRVCSTHLRLTTKRRKALRWRRLHLQRVFQHEVAGV